MDSRLLLREAGRLRARMSAIPEAEVLWLRVEAAVMEEEEEEEEEWVACARLAEGDGERLLLLLLDLWEWEKRGLWKRVRERRWWREGRGWVVGECMVGAVGEVAMAVGLEIVGVVSDGEGDEGGWRELGWRGELCRRRKVEGEVGMSCLFLRFLP